MGEESTKRDSRGKAATLSTLSHTPDILNGIFLSSFPFSFSLWSRPKARNERLICHVCHVGVRFDALAAHISTIVYHRLSLLRLPRGLAQLSKPKLLPVT